MGMTPEQRKAASDRMKAMHAAKKAKINTPTETKDTNLDTATAYHQAAQAAHNAAKPAITTEQYEQLMAKLQALEQAQTTPQQQPQPTQVREQVTISQNGQTVGIIDKFPITPGLYPSPVEDLYDTPKLRRFNIRENFILQWSVNGLVYATKFQTNVREPEFKLTVIQRSFDDDGNELPQGFRRGVLVLNEDELEALRIGQDMGLDLNQTQMRDLLNIARLERCRSWLVDLFLPPKVEPVENNQSEQVDPLTGRAMLLVNTQQVL